MGIMTHFIGSYSCDVCHFFLIDVRGGGREIEGLAVGVVFKRGTHDHCLA
jgi:hypothetical protein